ncbi:alpha/beta fold hydrolase [Streptomyces sp. TLI_105]|uniref:alpha/beta fold hydrolase n=1 Tax=Streptomyces sp. TLI_105 TaxID=1881019 RepID=UPI00089AA27D|nr:alpha/beta hydrolase [Streptomyces sp. TLI_105]SEC95897.1 Pimeloyl-ACP methyl ester carboxylesterase [Streptomyces sp. TLI_105]
METRTLTVPGGTLHAVSSGAPAGPAAVLVHSGIAHGQMWHPLMEALSDEMFSVAYDCRCFGRSTTTLDGEFSDLADLGSVLDAYGLESAVLVAESRGARLAIDFALAHPERVRGLFLLAPDVSGFDSPVADEERPLLEAVGAAEEAWDTAEAADVPRTVEELIALEVRLFVDGPGREPAPERASVREAVAEMLRLNYTQQKDTPDFTRPEPAADRLAKLDVPVRVLVGDADTLGMRATAEEIERAVPQASLVRVPDAAHALTLEREETVVRELRTWWRELRQLPQPGE